MAFDAFVEQVARTPDDGANLHIRTQTSLLFDGGEPPMLHVVALERLAQEWDGLREAMKATGFDIGRVPRPRPMPHQPRLADNPWTPQLVDLVTTRYAKDFERFYPNAQEPTWTRKDAPR
ncbi:MAG: hypothetical protein ROR55_09950 [Devosia sp.]